MQGDEEINQRMCCGVGFGNGSVWRITHAYIALPPCDAESYGMVNVSHLQQGVRVFVAGLGIDVGIVIVIDSSAALGVVNMIWI